MSDIIKMSEDELLVYQRWLTSPYYWFKDCVYTNDAARSELGLNPVRPWPSDEEYLKYLLYYADKYPINIVNKSRRMMLTWLYCLRLLYKVLFFQGQENFIICSKFDKSFKLVNDRIVKTYDAIPTVLTLNLEVNGVMREVTVNPKAMLPKIELKRKEGRLWVPDNNSYIQATVAGHNPLRGDSASNILFDEAASQPMIRETWKAIKHTTKGGGKIQVVSTPLNNDFKNLYYGWDNTAVPESIPKSKLITGLATFINSEGHFCAELNWRAASEASIDLEAINIERKNAEKSHLNTVTEYFMALAKEAGGVDSADWQEEMENSFSAGTKSRAAYNSFNRPYHTSQYPGIIPNAVVHIGIDFGWHAPAIVVAQTESFNGFLRLHLHKSWTRNDLTLKTFVGEVLQELNMLFPNCTQMWYCGHEGRIKEGGGTSEHTPIEELRKEFNIVPRFKYHFIHDGVAEVNKALEKSVRETSVVTVNPGDQLLVEMLDGGYRRGKNTKDGKTVPTQSYVKDGTYDHVSDAMRHIFYHIFKLQQNKGNVKQLKQKFQRPQFNIR